VGKVLSVDPDSRSADRRNPQTWNRYASALSDPVNNSDPTRKDIVDCNWNNSGSYSEGGISFSGILWAREAVDEEMYEIYLSIYSNANPGSKYLTGGASDAANSIIHELLHAAVDLYGGGAVSSRFNDNDTAPAGANVFRDAAADDAEVSNENLIINECGVGRNSGPE
jgi:hypothetical protein